MSNSSKTPTLHDPRQATVFHFTTASYTADGSVQLGYAFEHGPDLIERIHFPNAPTISGTRQAALQRALTWLHWVAGISYYKAGLPPALAFAQARPDPDAARLLNAIYHHGLAEFSYRNDLPLGQQLDFTPYAASHDVQAIELDLPARTLVPIGGGKDSLAVIEALKRSAHDVTLAFIGHSPLIAACAERTGLPYINIRRELAPELFAYNKMGAFNGHIPITAINSAILVMAALLYGFDAIAFANERSASEATLVTAEGHAVNHQWSKGATFEHDFAHYTRTHVAQDLDYFSLLRPFSELSVMRAFAHLGTAYHDVFSSCNRNFKLRGDKPADRWCGQCPKCHFVFLGLAPFLPKPTLLHIFGQNYLNNKGLYDAFDALLEYKQHKPFECVGEGHEARAAMASLARDPAWQNDAVVARFAADIAPQLNARDKQLSPWLEPAATHFVPPRFRDALHAIQEP